MGSKSQTSTSNSSPNPQVLQNLTAATQQAQNVSSAPFSSYDSSLVAGFTPLQQQAQANVTQASDLAQPYIGQAGSWVADATSGVPASINSTANISQYMNPYTSSVVNAQMALENQQDAQQQQVEGNAAAAGAFGGDRSTIAQTTLAGQQALANNATNSGLLSAGYTQALQSNQSDQEANAGIEESNANTALQGAFGLGQLGNEAQTSALQGVSSQYQMGTQEQQLAQEQLNAPYEAYQSAMAYPYQDTNFLSSTDAALGSLEGGSSSTTSPGPSGFSELAGLGTAAPGVAGLSNSGASLGPIRFGGV